MIDQPTTIGRLLSAKAEGCGAAKALIYPQKGVTYTYQQLYNEATSVSKALQALGVARGEHVAIWATNLSQWLIIQFGCSLAGNPLVALNTNYQTYELEYVLKQSDATTIFLADGASHLKEYLKSMHTLCPELATSPPGNLISSRFPKLKNIIYLGEGQMPGMLNWQEFLAKAPMVSNEEFATREHQVTGQDTFVIQYTSGTTGFPKGAMLSHQGYILNATAMAHCQKLTPQDVLFTPLPLFHAYGCLVIMTSIITGATAVVLERFQAKDMLQAMEQYRATMVSGTPTMFVAALAEKARQAYDLRSLRGGNMAGAPCPPELVRDVVETLGASEFGVLYGSTEAAVCMMNEPDELLEKRIRTLGKALPGIAIKIVDPETGEEVPYGLQGELCIKGPSNMKGYYNRPQETAKTLDADGWIHSGDAACVDSEGFYKMTGRIKDMIIRGGENIYPAEIESFLFTHPKVKSAEVVGIPCDFYGEEVVAFVSTKAGESVTPLELKRYCRAHIALNKVPAHFFFVEQFPQTASGKVQKFKLREMALELLANGQ